MTFITCGHDVSNSFKYNKFGKIKEPTINEIKKYRLWKCPDCNYYYSLIEVVK